MQKVNWGVLSTAKIGREKVIPAMQLGQYSHVAALASRSLASAQHWATQLNIPKAYGSYEELLQDPDIEAIYNSVPNDMHVHWTLAAARAGKHVLCEKPFSLTANEAAALREVAGQVHIMEAFMVRFHPQWLRARQLIEAGELGDIRAVQVFFSYYNADPANIRNRLHHGGGALYDVGCYAIVAGRFLMQAEPQRVIAMMDRDPQFQTDRMCSGLLDFGQGRRLDFTVSTQCVPYQRVHVIGQQQRLELDIPFNAPLGQATRIQLDTGKVHGSMQAQTETIPACNMYTLQGDAFSLAVRGQATLPYGLNDALCNMRVIDALFASEKSGTWEIVASA